MRLSHKCHNEWIYAFFLNEILCMFNDSVAMYALDLSLTNVNFLKQAIQSNNKLPEQILC